MATLIVRDQVAYLGVLSPHRKTVRSPPIEWRISRNAPIGATRRLCLGSRRYCTPCIVGWDPLLPFCRPDAARWGSKPIRKHRYALH